MEQLEVKFLSEGEWNRVYLVTDTSEGREFVFRASLPVYPWYKTRAEVATTQFIRDNTTIPVPKVYAFDSSADNALGFEWILMEKLPDTQYGSIAKYITMEENLAIARTIAVWMDHLSRLTFDTIGSFYSDQSGNLELGRPVIQYFMGDWRQEYHFERGPFDNLYSYIRSFVDCAGAELFDRRQHLHAMLGESSDGIRAAERSSFGSSPSRVKGVSSVDFETTRYRLAVPDGRSHNDFTSRLRRRSRLSDLVDTISLKPFDQGTTILYHWDISENNVLVDPVSRVPTGLIDWEQLYTIPLNLIRSRYPSIMARNGDFPDRMEPPPPRETDRGGRDVPEKSNDDYFWEKQLMREEFDRRLRELHPPNLRSVKTARMRLDAIEICTSTTSVENACSFTTSR